MTPTRRKRIIPVVLGILGAGAGVLLTYYFVTHAQTEPGRTAAAASAAPAPSTLAASNPGSGPAADQPGATDPNARAPIPVGVVAVTHGSVSSYISATANLVAEDEVKVLAEGEGRVAELFVEEGDRVSRGQVLASLAKEDAEIVLNKAILRATNARLAQERAVKAVDQQLMSRQDFDKVTMEDQIARQEQAEAQWRLDKTQIKSPFTGHLTHRSTRVGQHVKPGDEMFSVADFDPLIAAIYLPEKDVFGLKQGEQIRITLKSNETMKFQGRIRQISPVVDTATGTVKVIVEASSPPSDVRPGTFVTIDIVRESHPQALVLPREAIIRELQDAYVFVADNGVAVKRTVALGLEEAGFVEAVSGVTAGDQVIVAGQGGLKDGSPIKVMPHVEASDMDAMKSRPARG